MPFVPAGLARLPPELQPVDIPGFYGSDGVFIKPMIVARIGTYLAQHSHAYAHTSFIATGAARVWKEGVLIGDFTAPCGIEIEAHAKHKFMTLADNTTILCVHNVSRTGEVEIAEENHLDFDRG